MQRPCVLLVLLACTLLPAARAAGLKDLLHPHGSTPARAAYAEVESESVALQAVLEKGCECVVPGCTILSEEIDYVCDKEVPRSYHAGEGNYFESSLLGNLVVTSCAWTWTLTDPVQVGAGVSRAGSATATCHVKTEGCGPMCDGMILSFQGVRYTLVGNVAFAGGKPKEISEVDDNCGSGYKDGFSRRNTTKAAAGAAVSTANHGEGYYDDVMAEAGPYYMGSAHIVAGTFWVTSPHKHVPFQTGEMEYVCAWGELDPNPVASPPPDSVVVKPYGLKLKFLKSQAGY